VTTSPMADGRRADSERRRQRVLKALDQAIRDGADLSVSGLARAAGVDRTYFYRHRDLLDIDVVGSEEFRGVQFTPPGSECSIIFGKGVTSAAPGSIQGLYLVVSDIEQARAELIGRDIEVGEVFHDAGGLFHHSHEAGEVVHPAEGQARVAGPHPDRADYGSYAAFSDPDGNGWVLQEVKSGPRPLTPLSGTHGRDGEHPLQPLGAAPAEPSGADPGTERMASMSRRGPSWRGDVPMQDLARQKNVARQKT